MSLWIPAFFAALIGFIPLLTNSTARSVAFDGLLPNLKLPDKVDYRFAETVNVIPCAVTDSVLF